MTERPVVVICDDHEERRGEWRERLEGLLGDDAVVETLPDIREDWARLLQRRADARNRRAHADEAIGWNDLPVDDPTEEAPPNAFDRADVLVVDYDLFDYEQQDFLTGAIVAYVARCYSRCGVIVGVNEYGRNPFDLTMRRDLRSFADVSIGDAQIANPGLWRLGLAEGFRPWSWPPLLQQARRFRDQVAAVAADPDQSVMEGCGVKELLDFMPRSVVAFLERAGEDGVRTSFVDLGRGARLGYRANDEAPSRAAVFRVAAARTAQWLEAAVLPTQDVIVDAPHLVQRSPGVLGAEPTPDVLAAVTALDVPPERMPLRDEALRHALASGPWLSRAAFRWPQLRGDAEIPGVRNPREAPHLERVFCEDLSRFVQRDHARRFMSGLDTSSPARWIADPDHVPEVEGVDYRPQSRLAL